METDFSKNTDGILFSQDGTSLLKCDNPNLQDYTVPEGTTTIADNAFAICHNLHSVLLPDSLSIIGNRAFYCCRNLHSIKLNKHLKSIGDYAFAYCSNINVIELPRSLEHIGANPFLGCNIKIKSKSKIFKIDKNLLVDMKNYKIIACLKDDYIMFLPNVYDTIGESAFRELQLIKKIILPLFIDKIDSCAFLKCYNLEFVSMPNMSYYIGDWAFSQTAIRRIDIPNHVKSIGAAAFYACENLSTVTLPLDVGPIGNSAFSLCNIKDVLLRYRLKESDNYLEKQYYIKRKFNNLIT